jgi:hypothetical protein
MVKSVVGWLRGQGAFCGCFGMATALTPGQPLPYRSPSRPAVTPPPSHAGASYDHGGSVERAGAVEDSSDVDGDRSSVKLQ